MTQYPINRTFCTILACAKSLRWIGLIAVALTLVLFGVNPNLEYTLAQEGAAVGFRGIPYDGIGSASPTADKPQNKLWWNDGLWWADMISQRDGQHHIFRLNWNDQTWLDTNIALDPRPRSKSDVLWDEANGKLYIVSHAYSTANVPAYLTQGILLRYSYHPDSQTYSPDDGFPVLVMPGVAQSLTIAKDSTGQLWVTYVQDEQLIVRHSLGDDRMWSEPLALGEDSGYASDGDTSAVIAFDGKVGVAWSNQRTQGMYLALHQDGDSSDAWSYETIIQGERYADNHVHLAADDSGRLYLAAKTSRAAPLAALVVLYVRETTGRWNGFVYGYGRDDHTRPAIVIDDEHQQLFMFATSPQDGGAIYYKSAPLDDILFDAGTGTPLLYHPEARHLNNVTTTRQNVDSSTGIVVLASDTHTRRYYHNFLITDEVAVSD